MDNKQLIMRLIVEDMRFHQYRAALRKMDIEVNVYLNLMDVVAALMGIPVTLIPDTWMDCYTQAIYTSESLPIVPEGKNLAGLAEACYESLRIFE